MTYSEALKFCSKSFEDGGIENFGNESRWLLESIDDAFMLKLRDEMLPEDAEYYFSLADRRVQGEPLQYLLGSWEFYGYEYFVGPGVLIPRPETEMLVDFAKEVLKGVQNPVIIDLCAGSGCVGLTAVREIPGSAVYLYEKYEEAFTYLERNSRYIKNAKAIKADIFDDIDFPKCSLILSNPPYVERGDIGMLQKEVGFEPATALDGGDEGLDFYPRIARIAELTEARYIAVECGERQAERISGIFRDSGNVKIVPDFNGIKRIVTVSRCN